MRPPLPRLRWWFERGGHVTQACTSLAEIAPLDLGYAKDRSFASRARLRTLRERPTDGVCMRYGVSQRASFRAWQVGRNHQVRFFSVSQGCGQQATSPAGTHLYHDG